MFDKLLNRNTPKPDQEIPSQDTGPHDHAPASGEEPWPEEIRLKSDRRTLEVRYEDGVCHALPAEYLRVYSPSAEVRGHGADERKIIGGKRNVEIIKIEPVGNYAVRLSFGDLHNTGIFSWAYLAEMAEKRDEWWPAYLSALQDKGLSRD